MIRFEINFKFGIRLKLPYRPENSKHIRNFGQNSSMSGIFSRLFGILEYYDKILKWHEKFMKQVCLMPLVGWRPFFFFREHNKFEKSARKSKNRRLILSEDFFFGLYPRIPENFTFSAPQKIYSAMSARNSAYSDMVNPD